MMRAPQMQTPGGNLANADTKTTDLPTVPAYAARRNPTPAEFVRAQAKFAKHQHTLHRVRSVASTRVAYTVIHRGDARHLQTWAEVVRRLAEIGGAQ